MRPKPHVYTRFLSGTNGVTFQLLETLFEYETVEIKTDETSYLAIQTSPDMAIWIATRGEVGLSSADHLAAHIANAFARNPRLHFHGLEQDLQEVTSQLFYHHNLCCRPVGQQTAYVCREPRFPEPLSGQMIPATPWHRADVAQLMKDFYSGALQIEVTDDEAQAFADKSCRKPDFYLWQDGDTVTSMAQIAHRSEFLARINNVATRETLRGHGYAGMLVASLAQKLLNEGLTPMLYADAHYPSSNRAYQKVGFTPVAHVTEWQVEEVELPFD